MSRCATSCRRWRTVAVGFATGPRGSRCRRSAGAAGVRPGRPAYRRGRRRGATCCRSRTSLIVVTSSAITTIRAMRPSRSLRPERRRNGCERGADGVGRRAGVNRPGPAGGCATAVAPAPDPDGRRKGDPGDPAEVAGQGGAADGVAAGRLRVGECGRVLGGLPTATVGACGSGWR